MEENETRLAKLEQSDKEKAKLIAELNCDVGKIKQERVVIVKHQGQQASIFMYRFMQHILMSKLVTLQNLSPRLRQNRYQTSLPWSDRWTNARAEFTWTTFRTAGDKHFHRFIAYGLCRVRPYPLLYHGKN